MDRKLSHSLIALSVSGLILAALLLAADQVGGGAVGARSSSAAVVDSAAEDTVESGRPERRAAKGARRGLALPYFSFAHGMRRIGG